MKNFLMRKKVLLSLGLIGIVAVFAVVGTTAFFSDTETSEGNKFTSGAIDLTVDSQCTYNGEESEECGTWELKDLNPTADKFFNFTDVKPGDEGENTISLHIDSNDAYGCLMIDNMTNDDLGLTEPESFVDATDGAGNGELAEEINFFAWADDGDNIWEDGELPLFSNIYGPASDVLNGKVYPLGLLPASSTTFLGIYWCYGDMTVNEVDHNLACDGSAVTNASQTDQVTADIWFYVEQARNNEGFTCPELQTVLELENKSLENDGITWTPTYTGMNGELTYITSYATFDYTLDVQGLLAGKNYTLLYYADPWNGLNGIAIDTFTADASGNANVVGSQELNTSLPVALDANVATGAKIWVVLSSDWGGTGTGMTAWNPDQYLMEMNLVTYTNL